MQRKLPVIRCKVEFLYAEQMTLTVLGQDIDLVSRKTKQCVGLVECRNRKVTLEGREWGKRKGRRKVKCREDNQVQNDILEYSGRDWTYIGFRSMKAMVVAHGQQQERID